MGARGAVVVAILVSGLAVAAPPLPKGKRAPRPAPTHVIVRATEVAAGGATLRVAPGVPVSAGGAGITLLGDVQVTGRVPAAALGLLVARDVDLLDARGTTVGKVRAGARVRSGGRAGDRVTIEPAAPLAPEGRFVIDAAALSAEPREQVLPTTEYALLVARTRMPLAAAPKGPARAQLPAGCRLEPIAPPDAQGWIQVRTYGAFAIEGWVPRDRLAPEDPGEIPAAPSRGLTPNHEALVDAPIYAAPRAAKPIGTLRGGALVTAGVEVEGSRVKIMTHGDVVGELWIERAALRPLDASIWAEGR